MSRVDNLVIGAKVRSQFAAARAKDAVKSMVSKKPGDSQIVVALVLIAVAVGLCIIFRDAINDIMTSLFETIGDSIAKLAGSFDGNGKPVVPEGGNG